MRRKATSVSSPSSLWEALLTCNGAGGATWWGKERKSLIKKLKCFRKVCGAGRCNSVNLREVQLQAPGMAKSSQSSFSEYKEMENGEEGEV